MAAKFNADEIFTIAVDIETNGEKFYRRASELAEDEEAKKLLADLADWEQGHIKVFSEMHAELKDIDADDFDWDPYGEVELYLQSIADGQVFTFNKDSVTVAENCGSVREVLEFALAREKDAVIFYTSIDCVVPNQLVGDKVDAIVKEEISHVRLINEKLHQLGN
jgi:rubrerythrin